MSLGVDSLASIGSALAAGLGDVPLTPSGRDVITLSGDVDSLTADRRRADAEEGSDSVDLTLGISLKILVEKLEDRYVDLGQMIRTRGCSWLRC